MKDFLKGGGKFLAWTAGIIVVIGAVLRIFFIETATISHDGMSPTLCAGDRVAIWRASEFSIGDVVVCQHPSEPGRFVVGRVLGKPGMRVETIRGQLHIAGTKPDTDLRGTKRWLDITTGRVRRMQFGIEVLASSDHEFMIDPHDTLNLRPVSVTTGLFLLGDNRSYHAEDSRSFGQVDAATCRGKIFMILVPAADRGDDISHWWLSLVD